MTLIRNKMNSCLAEVDEALSKFLIEGGEWASADSPARKRTVTKPVEEPTEG
jgi:hypothetical protein